eukprot:SAG31_NODE_13527_length_863_cov_1.869110_2_plen_68_part_01
MGKLWYWPRCNSTVPGKAQAQASLSGRSTQREHDSERIRKASSTTVNSTLGEQDLQLELPQATDESLS